MTARMRWLGSLRDLCWAAMVWTTRSITDAHKVWLSLSPPRTTASGRRDRSGLVAWSQSEHVPERDISSTTT